METGPKGGFTVTKPYKGRTFLNIALCPAGCQACADVCPTNCISYDGEKVSLDARFCLFCGACENVCPVPGAVRIVRTGFVHTPVDSAPGAWPWRNWSPIANTLARSMSRGRTNGASWCWPP